MSDPDPKDVDLTAAEYVLGVLSGPDRRAAEERARSDAKFSREVEAWEGKLAPLLEESQTASPSPEVWARLDAALSAPVATLRPRRERGTAFWRAWAMGATGVAAASCAGLMLLLSQVAPPAHHMQAMLRTPDGAADVMVGYDTASRDLTVTPIGALPPPGRMPHLWLQRADGTLKALGPVDMAHPHRRRLPMAMGKDAEHAMVLLISLDSEGPAPSAPQGPIVARGRFTLV